ncbi:MAG: HD-GYP domain-containing protein [Solirubrobacterales bacterium]
MQRILAEELRPGMIVARAIVDNDGKPLMAQNSMLTDQAIGKLRQIGVGSIYTKNGIGDIDVPENISVRVVDSISESMKTLLKTFRTGKSFDMSSLVKGVDLLIADIMANRHLLLQLDDIRNHGTYLLYHSINVAAFSVMVGLALGYNERNLMELGLGALLHDVGMTTVNPDILNKPEALDSAEIRIVQRHPEIGYNILQTHREVSPTVSHIVYQHHERVDGSGYPRRLKSEQILEYAKIVAVADTYDAVVSDRPYRKGYSVTDGVILLQKLTDTYFDREIVEALASNVAMYPAGSFVGLNTGHIALVTAVNKVNSTRPMVQVICGRDGNLVSNYEVDLSEQPEMFIARRLGNIETNMVRLKLKIQQRNLQPGDVVCAEDFV